MLLIGQSHITCSYLLILNVWVLVVQEGLYLYRLVQFVLERRP